jgi:DNA-binding transcriptional MerR regulator
MSDDPVAGDSAPAAVPDTRQLSIGEVLDLLKEDFPDVTISKIRFLESRGLVEPERTASGYRQFSDGDIERLRWILLQQRDHFLPLKVIKQMLDAGMEHPPSGTGPAAQPSLFDEDGATPTPTLSRAHPTVGGPGAAPSGRSRQVVDGTSPRAAEQDPTDDELDALEESESAATGKSHSTPADVVAALQEDPRPRRRTSTVPVMPTVDAAALANAVTGARQTAEELCLTTGIDADTLAELEQFGLVEPLVVAGVKEYPVEAVAVVELAVRYLALGVEPRHLRIYKVSAEREAGFVEQLTMPLLKRHTPAARKEALDRAAELAQLGAQLHAEVLRARLGPSFRD